MIIYFGISWGLLAAIFLFALLSGAIALERAISFLLGPIKWIAIGIMIAASIWYVYISIFSDDIKDEKIHLRVVACTLNCISNFLRNGMAVTFLLCLLVGFLRNMDGNWFSKLFGIFAFLGDGMICLFVIGASVSFDYSVVLLNEKLPITIVGLINFTVSVIFFVIVKGLLRVYYSGIIEALFSNFPQIANFILTPLI